MPTSILGTVSVTVASSVSTEPFFYTSLGDTQEVRMSSDAEVAMPVTVMSANLGGSINVTSTVLTSAYICSVAPVSLITPSASVYVTSSVSIIGSVYVSSVVAVSLETPSASLYVTSSVSIIGSVYVSSIVAVSLITPSASVYVTSVVSIAGSTVITDVEKTVTFYASTIVFDVAETSILVSPGAAEKVQVKYLCVVSDTDDVVVKIWEEDTNTHMCFCANMLDGSAINANLIGANYITTTVNKDLEINASKAANIWVVIGYVLVS